MVTSWGSVNVKGVREDDGDGLESGPTTPKAQKGMKRKAVAKPLPSPEREVETHVTSDSESASQAYEDAEEYTELSTPEERGAKRRKVSNNDESTASYPEVDAAVRAAALGLRTRQ